MTEAETRAAIVAEALSWEGTPYHQYARVKGAGVDCAQLPAAVYEAVGLIAHMAPSYTSDWMMHRDEELYLAQVFPLASEIERSAIAPGDLAIWRFGRTFSHSAIIIEPPIVLHATISGRAVVRANMDQDSDLASRPVRFFSLIKGRA